MQIDFIKEIVSGIVGTGGSAIVDVLYKKKNVNEFLISKKLNLTINQTRNLLYKLSDRGLVHFIRKKDSKKGGWYTYFWTLNIEKSLELLKNEISNKITQLETDVAKRKSERFYVSTGAGMEYTEEEALENNFICPETGEVLELKDNAQLAEQLDMELSKLKIILEEVTMEYEDLLKKKQTQKERRLKIEVKKKEEERKVRREKLRKIREKEAKKSGKTIKKKVKKAKKKVKKKSTKKAKKKVKKKVSKKK